MLGWPWVNVHSLQWARMVYMHTALGILLAHRGELSALFLQFRNLDSLQICNNYAQRCMCSAVLSQHDTGKGTTQVQVDASAVRVAQVTSIHPAAQVTYPRCIIRLCGAGRTH
jgi:hypothetical protein